MADITENIDSLNIIEMPQAPAAQCLYPQLDTATVGDLPVVDFSLATDTIASEAVVDQWSNGMEPQMRHSSEANRSGLLTAIALFGILMAFNFKHLRRICSHYIEELTRPRTGRTNLFDDHPAGDTRLAIMLLTQFGVCAGILLSEGIIYNYHIPEATNLSIAAVVLLCVGYLLLQAVVYAVVGYTFGGKSVMRRWVASFSAVHALMGTISVIPMALAVFYPEAVKAVCYVSAIIYLIGRIIFIFRGFKIFYDNLLSCFYFILYLCTLEIIPLFLVYKYALVLTAKAL